MRDATVLTSGHATHAKIIAIAMIAAAVAVFALRNPRHSEALAATPHPAVAHSH